MKLSTVRLSQVVFSSDFLDGGSVSVVLRSVFCVLLTLVP